MFNWKYLLKMLMKNGEFTCFDDILAKIKQLSEAEKCMITKIITICKPSNQCSRREILFFYSTMTRTRFSNLTILNSPHKPRTDKLSLIDVANEFAAQ